MILRVLTFVMLGIICSNSRAQDKSQGATAAQAAADQDIRERLQAYVETFNSHDASAVARYWTADGVSVAEESGQHTEGRDAIQQEFAGFFEENSSARLNGHVSRIRLLTPNVATVEGQTTLFLPGAEPVMSVYSAVMIQQDGQWLISSSHERDLPSPTTPYDALRDLEWLVGAWEDKTEGAQVETTVRWSPRQAFLIRSFSAQFGEEEMLQGTQVIGWDPLSKQIRTWTFNSDGSFGQGTVSKQDDDWMLKMWQISVDGRLASATKVMTRIDDDTMTVQTIGETIDGEPSPTSDPVTVVRTQSDVVSSTVEASEEGATP